MHWQQWSSAQPLECNCCGWYTCSLQAAIVVDRATSVVVTTGFEEVYMVMYIHNIPFIVVPMTVYDRWSNMTDNNTTLKTPWFKIKMTLWTVLCAIGMYITLVSIWIILGCHGAPSEWATHSRGHSGWCATLSAAGLGCCNPSADQKCRHKEAKCCCYCK